MGIELHDFHPYRNATFRLAIKAIELHFERQKSLRCRDSVFGLTLEQTAANPARSSSAVIKICVKNVQGSPDFLVDRPCIITTIHIPIIGWLICMYPRGEYKWNGSTGEWVQFPMSHSVSYIQTLSCNTPESVIPRTRGWVLSCLLQVLVRATCSLVF